MMKAARSRRELESGNGMGRGRSSTVPAFVSEAADAVFGEKEFVPLATFARKIGLDRKTVLQLISEGLLDVFQYRPRTYRKMLVSKASFVRFLKVSSLRSAS